MYDRRRADRRFRTVEQQNEEELSLTLASSEQIADDSITRLTAGNCLDVAIFQDQFREASDSLSYFLQEIRLSFSETM
jgi:hypothetical protein